ncbi:uncharacterized protein LOC117102064 [Anneissia japonica]|uniref:uncharacterized protein LOC117102064 n=1 Tax=Anneissia japonica TaxID=1529436 RepID=UPI0014255091|nr:uncharacterized protein LOC117102064 [Anneissia japonica]
MTKNFQPTRITDTARRSEMDALLEEWGLESLKETFNENGVDMEAVELLNENDIAVLIPKIGLRVKFIEKWKKKFKQVIPEVIPLSTEVLQQLFSEEESIEDSYASQSTAQYSDLDEAATFNHIQPPTVSDSESPSHSPFSPPPLKRQKTVLFDVKDILSKTPEGRNVAKTIEETGFLTKKPRLQLVKILVGALVSQHGKNAGAFEKNALAQSLITCFPCLKDPQGITGYEAFYCKGAHGRPATGYLEEHLRYIRKRMLKSSTEEDKVASNDPKQSLSVESVEVTDDIIMKVQWLKDNLEPKNQVQQFMATTFNYRIEWIKDKQRSVSDILKEFPRLLDNDMIDQDFRSSYPEAADRMYEKWNAMVDPICEYGIRMCPLWKEILGLSDSTDLVSLTTDEKSVLALYLIPLIFENSVKKSAAGSKIASTLSSFIDSQRQIINVQAYVINPETHRQPFILALGDKLLPSDQFVIIENKVIQQPSLFKAVDVCYKLHYVLDCKYQEKCRWVWKFFESCVYSQSKEKRESASLRAMRAYLKFKNVL